MGDVLSLYVVAASSDRDAVQGHYFNGDAARPARRVVIIRANVVQHVRGPSTTRVATPSEYRGDDRVRCAVIAASA